jgi:hypothetical protein
MASVMQFWRSCYGARCRLPMLPSVMPRVAAASNRRTHGLGELAT